jgi:hypothetical protein
MNQLAIIGLNPSDFKQLLAARFYKQIVRPQLEYCLAINKVSSLLLDKLEIAQNKCLHKIVSGSYRFSINVMLQLTKSPTMTERTHILQAQFHLKLFVLIELCPPDLLVSTYTPLKKSFTVVYYINNIAVETMRAIY